MKKFFAVLLATAMLLSVCAVSASAASISLDTTKDGDSECFANDWLDGLGFVTLNTDLRTIDYGLWMKNKLDIESTYHFNAQCAVDYADETQDYEDYYGYWYFSDNVKEQDVSQKMHLSSEKTIIKIDAEFHISSAGNELWCGYISQTYTAGIDI